MIGVTYEYQVRVEAATFAEVQAILSRAEEEMKKVGVRIVDGVFRDCWGDGVPNAAERWPVVLSDDRITLTRARSIVENPDIWKETKEGREEVRRALKEAEGE